LAGAATFALDANHHINHHGGRAGNRRKGRASRTTNGHGSLSFIA